MSIPASLQAGLRTAEQTLVATLSTVVAGGAILGATNLFDINWKSFLGAVAFALIVSFFAGLKSYLSFVVNGVPAAYINAGTATSVPAVITNVQNVPSSAVATDVPAASADIGTLSSNPVEQVVGAATAGQ